MEAGGGGTAQLAAHGRVGGMSGDFHSCEDRLGLGGDEFTVGAFLLIPQIRQITGSLQDTLHSKSMRREAQGWHMG
jgi:hypothetical protein